MSTKPSGRPVTESRMLAVLNGDKTYTGKRCKRCNGTERYTRGGGSCVACQRAHSIESRVAMKRLAGAVHDQPPIPGGEEGLRLLQEACYYGAGHYGAGECPSPGHCEANGCAGAPASPVNDASDSTIDTPAAEVYLNEDDIPQPWD